MTRRKSNQKNSDQSSTLEYISERLKSAMQQKSITTFDVAVKIGMDRTRLQQIYNGQKAPDAQQLLKIAAALGVTLDELIPHIACPCTASAVPGDAMKNVAANTKKIKRDHVTYTATMDIGVAMARLASQNKSS